MQTTENNMTTYFVATRVRYVLIDAADEAEARQQGQIEFRKQYADQPERAAGIEIHTVRPATTDEIELWNWHNMMVAKHAR